MGNTYFFKKKKKKNFTILDNTCIQDKELSWKSKGVHTYLMSLPDDWKMYINELVTHSSDGKASLYSAIKELLQKGYLKKKISRDKNGRFETTVYCVYEKPEFGDDNIPLPENREVESPDMEEPNKGKPKTENKPLLSTNFTKDLNLKRTKPTNSENNSESQSTFKNLILKMFDGEYVFDSNFENDVLNRLEKSYIDKDMMESYVEYVFERTKLSNPQKSFEGMYRKLALSTSIARDFKLSIHGKRENQKNKIGHEIQKITCPICDTFFSVYEGYCPSCTVSVQAINSNDQSEIQVKRKLYQMSKEERNKYDAEYQVRVSKTGRGFLTDCELKQLYRDYGILN